MLKDWIHDLEYLEMVHDLMDHADVQRLANYTHHHITTRLAHSIGVSYRSYRWAKRLGLDARAVARAGLLHDLFFYESIDKHNAGPRGHNYEHPRIALENALKITELSDVEQDIILKHMFGATLDIPRYIESWIVTLMDKRCSIAEGSHYCSHKISYYLNQYRFYRQMKRYAAKAII